MMQNKGKIYVKKFIILLFWLGVWQILAMGVDNVLLVVTPLQALRALFIQAGQAEFWRSAFGSMWRIALGFYWGQYLRFFWQRSVTATRSQKRYCGHLWYSAKQYRWQCLQYSY